MKPCIACGKENDPSANFCGNCGMHSNGNPWHTISVKVGETEVKTVIYEFEKRLYFVATVDGKMSHRQEIGQQ